MSGFWTVLLAFRWPFIMAITLFAIQRGVDGDLIEDPERVLPAVLDRCMPSGFKGLIIAGMISAGVY